MTALSRNTEANQLLLSSVQPYKPITTTTLSRWCVTVMKESEININIFSSHSIRLASTINGKMSGLSFKELVKSAGWLDEKKLHDFIIGQFNRTLQIIYLDEIYFLSHIYVYAWCYLYRKYIYGVNYGRNNVTVIRLIKILNYYFFTHSLKYLFIRADWELIRR